MTDLAGGVVAKTHGGAAGMPQEEDAVAAGAMLHAARQAIGMPIEVLAASLKVSVAKLQALEAGDLDALSSPVFVRALASSVCRQVKLAPEAVLAKLPPSAQVVWAHSQIAPGFVEAPATSRRAGRAGVATRLRPDFLLATVANQRSGHPDG